MNKKSFKIRKHENNPPIYYLEGIINFKSVSLLKEKLNIFRPCILDMGKIKDIDKEAEKPLIQLSKDFRFIIWNAPIYIKNRLEFQGINAEFLIYDPASENSRL